MTIIISVMVMLRDVGLETWSPLASSIPDTCEVLDMVPCAAFVIDEHARVVACNALGRLVVASDAAMHFDKGGAVWAWICGFLRDGETEGYMYVPPFTVLRLTRFRRSAGFALLRARMVREDRLPSVEEVGSIFDLGRTQSILLRCLMAGERFTALAKRNGIPHETARYHLKRLMDAFECGSQVELVAKVYRMIG